MRPNTLALGSSKQGTSSCWPMLMNALRTVLQLSAVTRELVHCLVCKLKHYLRLADAVEFDDSYLFYKVCGCELGFQLDQLQAVSDEMRIRVKWDRPVRHVSTCLPVSFPFKPLVIKHGNGSGFCQGQSW